MERTPLPKAAPVDTTAESEWTIGTPVWIRRKGQPSLEGLVAYVGPVRFASNSPKPKSDWIGIQLTGSSLHQGKHDGTVQNVTYFTTEEPNSGLFVRASALSMRYTSPRSAAAPAPQTIFRTPAAKARTPTSTDGAVSMSRSVSSTSSSASQKAQEKRRLELEQWRQQAAGSQKVAPESTAALSPPETEINDDSGFDMSSISPTAVAAVTMAISQTPTVAAAAAATTPPRGQMPATKSPPQSQVAARSISPDVTTGRTTRRAVAAVTPQPVPQAQQHEQEEEPTTNGEAQPQTQIRSQEKDHQKDAVGGWCQGLMVCLLTLASLVSPTWWALSLASHNDDDDSLVPPTRMSHTAFFPTSTATATNPLASGLLMGHVGTCFALMTPLMGAILVSGLCCCCCPPNNTTASWRWSWYAARVASATSIWSSFLLVLISLTVLSSSSSDIPDDDANNNTTMILGNHDTENNLQEQAHAIPFWNVLLATSAGSLLLAALALMISYWPASTGQGRPKVFRRHLYPVLQTVDHDNNLTEPLLSQETSGDDDDHHDVEAPAHDSLENDNNDIEPPATTNRVRGTRRLLQLASSQVGYLYLGCVALLIRLPFSLAIPHFVSTTLAAVGRGDFHAAKQEILFLFVLGSIDAALDFWCIFLFGYANQRIVRNVRLDLFRRLLRMEVSFFDVNNTGTLASRLNSDCSEMAGDLTWFFRFSIESMVRITGITTYMLIRSPRLGACALSIVPVVGIINKVYGDWLRDNAIAVQDALAEANAVAQEALSNIRTVIAFAAEESEESHYREKIQCQYRLNVKQLFMQGVYYMTVSTFLINTFVQSALLYYGSYLIERDMLTPEVLLAFMLYQSQLQQETLNLFNSFSSLVKSSGAGDKVFALLDRQPPPPATGSDQVAQETAVDALSSDPEPLSYDFRLQNVSFSYPSRPTQPILKDLKLDIPQGSTVALVGPSGCGKSTVINLLQRFYDPTSGSIMLNGRDLRSYDLHQHRRRIGLVSQECVLFDGSIIDNITYGSSRPTDGTDDDIVMMADVVRASTLAHADVFIKELPHGYNTVVGEKGVQLSGGQRQRISIARAIYQRPLLLILDEATSALDRQSEQVVQQALDDLLRHQQEEQKSILSISNGAASHTTTTIVIAHRLHTVENADFIAVLDGGRVAEFGPPGNLMRRPQGLYRQLVNRAQHTGRIDEK
eukprot:CAMPEP_0172464240 /NCGR_PEP_ID=MMETSP1065-20121228/49873_1 /TAXON_ID=265537 /ORGANISM="Amphiprora paludosa, Strain CCMP125" /LENGTH=1193 /DNA_ID=CAMNT_0013220419 /DNA_START=26 /DNA_END=3607 /DNA_ORIENTATION=+